MFAPPSAKNATIGPMEKDIIRKKIIFRGRVQGVGFRYYSVHGAESFGITGWVENLPDGTVAMEVQGREEDIDRLILFLSGRTYIDITDIDAKSIPVIDDEYSFSVRESW